MDDTMNPNTEVKNKFVPAIGIDLGTSKCCVGVVRGGKVEIIENERGSKITPSYVAFTKTMRIIGEEAKNQASQNPSNTIFGVKRIIGRSFDDPSLEDVKDKFPFKVKQEDGKPRIEVSYRDKTIDLRPEQVSAMLLTKMKLIAESHLKCKVTNAVISVPAYFTNAQRQATKDAAAISGLNVLGLINEPTAAALAYRDNMGPTDETICVVDLGGGKLDVSIITLNANDGIMVEHTMGDTAIGGMDIDQQLVDHFVGKFCETTNQSVSRKGLERLRLACEKLKHKLSLLPTAKIQLDCLAMDMDLESSIDRKTFEDLYLKNLSSVLRKLLQCSKHGRRGECAKKFTKVVVVGGLTRVLLVREILEDVLGKSLDKSVNPDEAVAHGAAIKAALLAGDKFIKEVKIQEITAHAIEMEIGCFKDNVFQQNSHETQKLFTPPPELDFHAPFILNECVHDAKSDNKVSHYLGSVKLNDLSKPLFSEMIFSLDDTGIVCRNIVVDKNHYSIPFYADYLNTDQLTQLRSKEGHFKADEESEKMRLVLLNDLGDKCYSLKNLIEQICVDDNSERNKNKKFINFCDKTIDWLDCYPEATKELCESKNKELQNMYNALVKPSNNANKKETNEKIIPCVENTKVPSETTQRSTQSTTNMYPKLNILHTKESLGERGDVQDNSINKQNGGVVGDQLTLQHGGGPTSGNNTKRSNETCVEYFDEGKISWGMHGQQPIAAHEVHFVPRNSSSDSISSSEIQFIDNHFNDKFPLSVDSEAGHTSVDEDALHRSEPTTASGPTSRGASLGGAQGSSASHTAGLRVKQQESSSQQTYSEPSTVSRARKYASTKVGTFIKTVGDIFVRKT